MNLDSILDQIVEFLKTARFLKLTNDIAFKTFFKANVELLKSLLTHFLPLPARSVILEVEILDPELHPRKLLLIGEKSGKDFILDLRVKFKRTLPDGRKFIETVNVEVQTVFESYLMDRTLVYVARLLSEQLQKGKSYKNLSPVYSLLFTTQNLKEFESVKNYYHICNIRRTEPPEVLMSKMMQFVIVELGKFDKNTKALYNVRDSWCYLLKHSNQMGHLEYKHLLEKGGDMAKAVSHLWNLSQDEILREYTQALEKREIDRISREDEVLEKGREEGREEVALNMLKMDVDLKVILNSTKLSQQEIEELKKQIK